MSGFDYEIDKDQNINEPPGWRLIVADCKKIKRRALAWMGPDCSNWVFSSSSKHKRGGREPLMDGVPGSGYFFHFSLTFRGTRSIHYGCVRSRGSPSSLALSLQLSFHQCTTQSERCMCIWMYPNVQKYCKTCVWGQQGASGFWLQRSMLGLGRCLKTKFKHVYGEHRCHFCLCASMLHECITSRHMELDTHVFY